MRQLMPVLIVLALGVVTLVGCEKGGTAPEGERIPTAVQFDDGAESYFMYQHKCPVCDGEPIRGKFYVDTEKGRVYFDKKECRGRFNGNKEKYLRKLDEHMKKTLGG